VAACLFSRAVQLGQQRGRIERRPQKFCERTSRPIRWVRGGGIRVGAPLNSVRVAAHRPHGLNGARHLSITATELKKCLRKFRFAAGRDRCGPKQKRRQLLLLWREKYPKDCSCPRSGDVPLGLCTVVPMPGKANIVMKLQPAADRPAVSFSLECRVQPAKSPLPLQVRCSALVTIFLQMQHSARLTMPNLRS